MGRNRKDYDKKQFVDLVGLGCSEKEICWWFRDEKGKPANNDTLTRWCKREFGMTFKEFYEKNGAMMLKVKLRQNQLALSSKSAAMAIFLGKNYLDQRDAFETIDNRPIEKLEEILEGIEENAKNGVNIQQKTE